MKGTSKMVKVRKLTDEEVASMEQNTHTSNSRKVVQNLYDSILEPFGPGDFVEVQLAENDTKQTVKNNITKALKRRYLTATWKRSKSSLKFHINELSMEVGFSV